MGACRSAEIAENWKSESGDFVLADYARSIAKLYNDGVWRTVPLEEVAWIEHCIWPGKVLNGTVSNFIVPIEKQWAMRLLYGVGAASLGGSDGPSLRSESVFYMGVPNVRVTAPARILWYVTGARRERGTMTIRGCSRLVEVAIGKPKDLLNRFRRLSIFRWPDVLKIAEASVDGAVMALRFTDTELLANPVPLSKLLSELIAIYAKPPIVHPIAISTSAFFKLYCDAIRINEYP